MTEGASCREASHRPWQLREPWPYPPGRAAFPRPVPRLRPFLPRLELRLSFVGDFLLHGLVQAHLRGPVALVSAWGGSAVAVTNAPADGGRRRVPAALGGPGQLPGLAGRAPWSTGEPLAPHGPQLAAAPCPPFWNAAAFTASLGTLCSNFAHPNKCRLLSVITVPTFTLSSVAQLLSPDRCWCFPLLPSSCQGHRHFSLLAGSVMSLHITLLTILELTVMMEISKQAEETFNTTVYDLFL